MMNIIKTFWTNIKSIVNQDYRRPWLKGYKSENYEKPDITENDIIQQQDIVSNFLGITRFN